MKLSLMLCDAAHGTGKRRKRRIEKGMGASQGGVLWEGAKEGARAGVKSV